MRLCPQCAPGGEDLGRRAHRGEACQGAAAAGDLRCTSPPSALTSRCLLSFFFFFRPPLSGCQAEWRLLLCAVVFSFIQPSKRTPFRGGLEDGRRRSRRHGEGDEILYSDTYRNGGARCLRGRGGDDRSNRCLLCIGIKTTLGPYAGF